MKLLLHTCCAPCAIYPIKLAESENYKNITLFFYNPNIHPESEYIKREKELKKITQKNLDIVDFKYNPEEYFRNIKDFEHTSERCPACWEMRLAKTADFAKEKRMDAFTTTLLASPYQNHDIIKEIGQALSKKTGVNFYYRDFRTGFRESHDIAREKGIYCQRYCGCIFSLVEREEARRVKEKRIWVSRG